MGLGRSWRGISKAHSLSECSPWADCLSLRLSPCIPSWQVAVSHSCPPAVWVLGVPWLMSWIKSFPSLPSAAKSVTVKNTSFSHAGQTWIAETSPPSIPESNFLPPLFLCLLYSFLLPFLPHLGGRSALDLWYKNATGHLTATFSLQAPSMGDTAAPSSTSTTAASQVHI